MLHAPSTTRRNREILLIYGHHAMIERWWSLIENLRQYGPVTMPDMPGFGGMQSFYTIGTKPDIDTFADYLASFIKFKYKRKRLTIMAISYGFVVVTRMLQRYPELAKKVDLLISFAGFVQTSDFQWGEGKSRFYSVCARTLATRPIATFIRYFALNRFVIKFLTNVMPRSKHRYIKVTPEQFESTMDFEVKLWRANDVRTHWLTTGQFFRLDNTRGRIDLPVIHVESKGEHYLDNLKVEEHMRKVFKDYKKFTSKNAAHMPHTTADIATTAAMIPPGLKLILSKKS